MSNAPSVYRASGPMASRPAYRAPTPKRVEHNRPNRASRHTTHTTHGTITAPIAGSDTFPFTVVYRGRVGSYSNGRDALAFARAHDGAEVYFTAPRTEVLDVHALPADDKAKPAKGSCGTFARGQTTKFVPVIAMRENVTTRVY